MTDQTINRDDYALALKERSGWFAAGDSFRLALLTLSDGAFKLFAHLCLEADRRTGRYEAALSELAHRIGKSRRIVGKYVGELEQKGVCAIRQGRNQYARTCFKIRDEYWPYRRVHDLGSNAGHERNAFVDAIRDSFVSLGCTTGKFSSRDACLAGDWQQRGIPLNVAQDALLMGACRKYSSWFNSGPTEPIGSLAYFESLIAEMQERPLPAGYDTYLRRKIVQLAGAWAKKTVQSSGRGDAEIGAVRRLSNSGPPTRPFFRRQTGLTRARPAAQSACAKR